MRGKSLVTTTRNLVLTLSALYLIAAIAGTALLDFDTTRNVLVWFGFLFGGAVLMLIGQLASDYPGRVSAVLVSIGAALGGLPLLGTIIVPVAVATVIACSLALARQSSVPT